jgi:lytic murein transglycosylase
MKMKSAILAVAALFSFTAHTYADAPFEQIMSHSTNKTDFHNWLERKVWPDAKREGISRSTFNAALSGVTPDWSLPDLIKPGSKKPPSGKQSEFSSPENYFKPAKIDPMLGAGKQLLKQWKQTLDAIEKRFGVPRNILIAIWGSESGFGTAKLPLNAFQALATESFAGARKELFYPELIAALKIVQEGHIRPAEMKSIWAGALGQPQFMPSKYLQYAVDFDGDGRRDIWTSVPDTLASIANFLRRYGWRTGRDWGFEATIPGSVSCTMEGPDQGKPIAEWIKLGIKRVKGKPFPARERALNGYLLFPAGRFGPAFLVTENFYVLKEYNESDLYALLIGHMADRLSGSKPFINQWGKVGGFSRADVRDMQLRLEKKGHDVGGADGLVGFKTRRTVGKWQEKHGMTATCYPDAELVKKIR